MVAVCDAVTVIAVPTEVAEQLLAFVTLTVYVPAAVAVQVAFVAFVIVPPVLDHW